MTGCNDKGVPHRLVHPLNEAGQGQLHGVKEKNNSDRRKMRRVKAKKVWSMYGKVCERCGEG